MLRVLDLFSGIGGFSLGLERTGGFRTVGFCEIATAALRILAKHWPEVPCAPDIKARIFTHGEADVITGGFPCQDISSAGSRAGITGSRSGLWREMLRAIRVVRPLYAIVENVAALRRRGLSTLLGDLAEVGYDAEWHCIPGAAVGSPDIRDRLWCIAQPQHSDTNSLGSHQAEVDQHGSPELRDGQDRQPRPLVQALSDELARLGSKPRRGWNPEPRICRVGPGTAANIHRVKLLGNAVKPPIPELIGRAILAAEADRARSATSLSSGIITMVDKLTESDEKAMAEIERQFDEAWDIFQSTKPRATAEYRDASDAFFAAAFLLARHRASIRKQEAPSQ